MKAFEETIDAAWTDLRDRAPVVTALDLDLDAWTAAAGLTDGGR